MNKKPPAGVAVLQLPGPKIWNAPEFEAMKSSRSGVEVLTRINIT